MKVVSAVVIAGAVLLSSLVLGAAYAVSHRYVVVDQSPNVLWRLDQFTGEQSSCGWKVGKTWCRPATERE